MLLSRIEHGFIGYEGSSYLDLEKGRHRRCVGIEYMTIDQSGQSTLYFVAGTFPRRLDSTREFLCFTGFFF